MSAVNVRSIVLNELKHVTRRQQAGMAKQVNSFLSAKLARFVLVIALYTIRNILGNRGVSKNDCIWYTANGDCPFRQLFWRYKTMG